MRNVPSGVNISAHAIRYERGQGHEETTIDNEFDLTPFAH